MKQERIITAVFKLSLFAFLLFTTLHSFAQSGNSHQFRFADRQKDIKILTQVEKAFADELSPDDPVKVAPVIAYKYKTISRIGIVDTSAIIIIRIRENKEDTQSGDIYKVYNFDLTSNVKSEIFHSNPFVNMKFHGFGNFISNTIPDIIFTSFNCWECEAEQSLSSFRYDSKVRKWKIRYWVPKQDSIWIGSAIEYGDENNFDYKCLYKIQPMNSSNSDSVILFCRQTNYDEKFKPTGKSDEIYFYKVENDSTESIKVTNSNDIARIKNHLCNTAHPATPNYFVNAKTKAAMCLDKEK